MAMTATLACSPTTVTAGPNGKTTATVTVSNSGAVPVNVIGIRPYVVKAGAGEDQKAAPVPHVTLLGNQSVANGGSTKYTFEVVFHAPQYGDAATTLDVGCHVLCDDGTQVDPTTVTITLNPRT